MLLWIETPNGRFVNATAVTEVRPRQQHSLRGGGLNWEVVATAGPVTNEDENEIVLSGPCDDEQHARQLAFHVVTLIADYGNSGGVLRHGKNGFERETIPAP